jgi:hypothetical protein
MAPVLGARASAQQNRPLPADRQKLPSATRRSQSPEKTASRTRCLTSDCRHSSLIVPAQIDATIGAESPARAGALRRPQIGANLAKKTQSSTNYRKNRRLNLDSATDFNQPTRSKTRARLPLGRPGAAKAASHLGVRNGAQRAGRSLTDGRLTIQCPLLPPEEAAYFILRPLLRDIDHHRERAAT